MDTSFLANIALQKKEDEEEARKLGHSKFRDAWLEAISIHEDRFKNELNRPAFGEDVILCPEPITFIKEFDDVADQQEKCREIFNNMLPEFKRIKNVKAPQNENWFNTTLNGVNLRPGLQNNEKSSPKAVTMGDLAVHGVVVGRTGAGKSVFLNNLIFNMLTEYAPWELDLYLADFKKVELSRYMTKYKTPHVKACAATSEIRYVISLIQYLVDCMYARQNLFSRLGIQKIADFRKKYPGLVLPRVVLLVDEFQQMFLEATNREANKIQEMLMAIIKLGRATGFHLLFASQEMSGALSAKALANFKIRFALPCEAEVSLAILGNVAASTLEVGNVLVNTASGKMEDNQLFKVPFVADEGKDGQESYFYSYLREQEALQQDYDFSKIKKFYQEDSRSPMENLDDTLDRIKEVRENLVKNSAGRYFEVFTLGEAVVYNDRNVDLETFFLERGKNKNVIGVSPDVDDIAYMQKLLATNYAKSVFSNQYQHLYFSFNPIVANKYQIATDLRNVDVRENIDDLEGVEQLYNLRKNIEKSLVTCNRDLPTYIQSYFGSFGSNVQGTIQLILDIFEDCSIDEIPSICDELLEQNPNNTAITDPIMYYYKYYIDGEQNVANVLRPYIVWISGIDSVDKLPRAMTTIMKNAMDVNIVFHIFTSTDDGNIRTLLSASDYIFISGNDPKLYDRCGVNYTNKSRDSIVIDFKIKSLNTERSFKKYKCKFAESIAPFIDFDNIFN